MSDFNFIEDNTNDEVTIPELYSRLLCDEDIILDNLPSMQFTLLKRGLSSFKAKQNARLRRNDLPIEDRRIEYDIIHQDLKTGLMKVRVFFNQPISIHATVITADGNIGSED